MRWLFLFLFLGAPLFAAPPDHQCSGPIKGHQTCIRHAHSTFDTCQAVRDLSRIHRLDIGFFARLIWQESRFDPNALSPAGAQGIAQFMPQTAKLRGLSNAYNPAQALDYSAAYLADLKERFGNLGLAAVAYNGGETRATNFINKTAGLAQETIDYVEIITGQSATDWRDRPPKTLDLSLDTAKPFMAACFTMAKGRKVSKLKSLNPKPQLPPWGVQMASGSTQSKAKSSYTRNARSCRTVIGKRKPNYIKKSPQVTGRKPYFVARLGANTRGSAQKLCNRMRKFNCICVVYRN